MADEWVERSLGDVIDIRHGFAFQGEFFRDEPPGDVLLTPGNFAIGGGFKSDKFKFYNGPVPDEFVLREGDLLITMTDLSRNADTLGYPAFVPPSSEGRRFLHNQRLGKVFIKAGEAVDIRYLHYLLCSREYRHEIIAGATGTTVKHTSPERIKRFHFLLPPEAEQRAIAHILSTLDDKIELNRRMNETLEATARAIYKSWFVDFELFRDQGMQDSPLGPIPVGWDVVPIETLGEIVCGKTPPTHDADNYGGTIPFITIPNMRNRVFITQTGNYLTEKGSKTQRNKLLPRNAVCVSCIATPGLVSLTSQPSHTNQQINSIICDDNISPVWCYLAMNMLRHEILTGGAGGSATLNLNTAEFSKIKVIKPTKDRMWKFHKITESMFIRLLSNDLENSTLAALRDAMLPKLISGEIRIRDAERFIAEAGA